MILIPRVILPQSDSTGRGRPIYRKPIIREHQLYKTNIAPNLPVTHHPRASTLQDQHRSLTPNFTNFIVCRHPVCRSSNIIQSTRPTSTADANSTRTTLSLTPNYTNFIVH
ncbi:hypothetical protein DPMN_086486 [Dreissena polymorpha]|uniref:Uncharacterized protein n=1 Tax=Dreissena polymorpha TaxID=45954 RepID=A0A9D4QW09_DREPO|nr:hypothetical protein DPMN_086486 [Dreissena polymorpha]